VILEVSVKSSIDYQFGQQGLFRWVKNHSLMTSTWTISLLHMFHGLFPRSNCHQNLSYVSGKIFPTPQDPQVICLGTDEVYVALSNSNLVQVIEK